MKLLRQAARNFQGVHDQEVELDGHNIALYGDNGTGKTTFANEFFWGLFGKDIYNRADFKVKPLDDQGREIHNLDTEVEIEFELEDGKTKTFRRIQRENWVQPRGATKSELQGNVCTYEVNGVPCREREYVEQVAMLGGDEKTFRLLTDPTYFPSVLKWEERRAMLVDTFGDVSDQDVIDMTPVLKPLTAMLEGRSIDDFRKVTEAARKRVNDEIKEIPVRIDQESKRLPDETVGDHQAEVTRLSDEIKLLERDRAEAASGGDIAKTKTEIQNVEGKILDLRNNVKTVENPERNKALVNRRRLGELLEEKRTELRVANRKLDEQKRDHENLAKELERLRGYFATENAKEWNGHTECATCGQVLPAEKVQSAREKFNTDKANLLDEIKKTGQSKRRDHDDLALVIKNAAESVEGIEAEIKKLEAELEALVIPEAVTVDYRESDEYKQLDAQKTTLATKLEELQNGAQERVGEIDEKLAELRGNLQKANQAVSDAKAREAGLKEIEALEKREKELSAQAEKLNRGLHLADEFVRAKVKLLTDRINSRFRIAKFKLFEEQMNGGLKECCEATVNGVPYGSLNTGSRVNVGLDIIDVLSRERGFAPPIFIDNAESVTDILRTQGQQIQLHVSEPDKALRVVRYVSGQTIPVKNGAQRPKQKVIA